MQNHTTINDLAKALFIVNRHAKAALKPQHLYTIKKQAIEKLLNQKKAEKIGLHFSNNPTLSNQHSTLLVKVGQYYFHLPPSKEDFRKLEHLGTQDEDFRNPPAKMSLSQAKRILYQFIGWKETNAKPKAKRFPSYYTPSSLGKMEWPPTKKF